MPGPAARPALAVVREGNPSHRPVPESVVLPPADDFPEPSWAREFPEAKAPKKPAEPEREPDHAHRAPDGSHRVGLGEAEVLDAHRTRTED